MERGDDGERRRIGAIVRRRHRRRRTGRAVRRASGSRATSTRVVARRLRRPAQLGDARHQRLPRPSRHPSGASCAAWAATRRASTACELVDARLRARHAARRGSLRADARRAASAVTHARLLLAIGLKDVWPDIPGLERVYGSTAHVCPDCDGYDCRDKKVVVIGRAERRWAWRSTSPRGRATSSSARTASRRTSTCRSTATSSTRSTSP